MSMEVTAAVLDEVGAAFVLRNLTLDAPAPDEVIIEVVGVGLCHTDLAVQHGHLPFALPGVVGHEGSGIVVAVGTDVQKVVVGDRVTATFNSCGNCAQCAKNKPSYCVEFLPRNFSGARLDGTS